MWAIVTRCPEPRQAVYAAILASLLRRGAVIVDGEWGRSVSAIHGPPYPSPHQGSGKRVTIRLGDDERGLTKLELILEARMGDTYTALAAVLALTAPLITLVNSIAGIAVGVSSATLGMLSMLTSSIDSNWCTSLLEEACLEASEYKELVDREQTCHIECSEASGGYSCTIAPLSSREILSASLAILGFSVKGSTAYTSSLRIDYRCSASSCTLLFKPRRLYPRPTIYTAILTTMLASKIAC